MVALARMALGKTSPHSAGSRLLDEYEHSNAERGKFFRNDATLELPIYLDPEVRDYLAARAKDKGIEVNQLVNELLKRDIELIETAK